MNKKKQNIGQGTVEIGQRIGTYSARGHKNMGQEGSRIYWTGSWQNIVQDQGNIPCQKVRNPDQNWCKLLTGFFPGTERKYLYCFIYLNITSIV